MVVAMSEDRDDRVEELAHELKIPSDEAHRLLENMEADR